MSEGTLHSWTRSHSAQPKRRNIKTERLSVIIIYKLSCVIKRLPPCQYLEFPDSVKSWISGEITHARLGFYCYRKILLGSLMANTTIKIPYPVEFVVGQCKYTMLKYY